ncbi:thioesterase family protein [delta proteobacterium NaphS2]|nr:thioesterase family protein [delta proteobacterium NaphS2]
MLNETDPKVPIQKLQGHHCFACGTDNPIGLNMQFYHRGDMVCSDITLGKNHEGWENMVHGGIISTLLDEVMSWTVLYFKRTFLVTRKMNIKYIRPVPLDVPLTARGKILNETDNAKIDVRGEIVDSENKLFVRSRAEFIMLDEKRLTSVSKGMKQEMMDMFDRFE